MCDRESSLCQCRLRITRRSASLTYGTDRPAPDSSAARIRIIFCAQARGESFGSMIEQCSASSFSFLPPLFMVVVPAQHQTNDIWAMRRLQPPLHEHMLLKDAHISYCVGEKVGISSIEKAR